MRTAFQISRSNRSLATGTGSGATRSDRTGRSSWQTALALSALASQLAGAAYGLGLLASLLLRGLLVIIAQLHFAEDTFALQLLLQCAQRLVNIVIANDYLQRSNALSKLGKLFG
jgi:hypothetical protein